MRKLSKSVNKYAVKFIKKFIAILLILVMNFGMIPKVLLADLDLSEIFAHSSASAAEIAETNVSASNDTNIDTDSGSKYTAPGCSFMDELYDGSDAIAPLPSYKEYKEQTGYTEPLRISLTDFIASCGEGLTFDTAIANTYMSNGYKLMICDAEELYNYSQIVNGAGSPDEIAFYLSANIVLGNNIEFAEMSYDELYFLPIGSDSNPFTGTFDGQCFEIRDLYVDKSYDHATVAFFGVIGEGAEIKNFGLFHPTINSTKNNSTFTAAIAARNYGFIDSVYAIAQEYRDPDSVADVNIISSANARCAGGLVAKNYESGTVSNSYFAGMLEASNPVSQHPICADNIGTITNCYYDSQVFAAGLSGSVISEIDGEVTGLNNIDLKKVGISENGMQNTKFKLIPAVLNFSYAHNNQNWWAYPRLYGFTGTGAEDDPYIISTPADLIYFPTSAEYMFNNSMKYFQLEKCIDMNEVAPNSYKPNMDFTFYTNRTAGGKWLQGVNIYNNYYFRGSLSGAAHNGDSECSICHVTDRGVNANGEPLQECHAILNLTINTPATSVSIPGYYYTALIATAHSFSNTTYFPSVCDLNFIGGEISSGDGDCMPAKYNAAVFNACTSTVVSWSAYVDMSNVHSSATVRMGTGKQYSVALGGLMAVGNYHHVTDCTNSGNIIGGYVDMPGEDFLGENFQIGGLLGRCASYNTVEARFIGKLTHVANYGNLYSAVVVAPKDSGWTLTGGSCVTCGISIGNLASVQTGNTINNPSGQDSYEYNDSNRCDRIANFGMIFDGPIILDENDNPVFDEEGKPQPLPLDEGKEIVEKNSLLYYTTLHGIGSDVISHAYNEGNIYSVMIAKSHLSGIGTMSNPYNDGINQYYNFLNYNTGNLYMYAGASQASGIARCYAYKCYNNGNIYMMDGTINTNSSLFVSSDKGGTFSGISGYDSKACYNDGDIYIAPSARSIYNSASSVNTALAVSGVSNRFSGYISETDKHGNTTIIPTINAGKVTIDLDTNNFDPIENTGSLTNPAYYPTFYMMGTALGSYCENYGEFSFIANTQDKNNMVRLYIAACGGLFTNCWTANISNTKNYSDISIDTSNAEGGLHTLCVYGIGLNGSNAKIHYKISDCVNIGDISFKGYLGGGGLTVYSLGGKTHKVSNSAFLGNISIDESSVIKGNVYIYGVFSYNYDGQNMELDSVMFGWHDGCKLPPGLDNEGFSSILATLDKSERYGQINISGKFDAAVSVIPVSYPYIDKNFKYAKNVINNGYYTVTNAEIKSGLYLYGLANTPLSFSENHAPITVENVLLHDSNSSIYGAAAGKNNVNYAPINVTHCIEMTSNGARYTSISGISSSHRVSNCENRGNITIKECTTATVGGKLYKAPILEGTSGLYDSIYTVGGVGSNAESCINFGDISISEVNRCIIGGIGSSLSNSMDNNYNYGNITCTNSGGQLRIGGIVGNIEGKYSISDCYNFGKVSVENPNSYQVYNWSPHIYFGGICGYIGNVASSISSSVNYGELCYNNTKGENTAQSSDNTRNYYLYIGGVAGLESGSNTLTSSMNYADITIQNELNMNVFAGGITGCAYFNGKTVSSGMINYANVTVPDANTSTDQSVFCGGIIAAAVSSGSKSKKYEYGINYGTVRSATENAPKTYVGSILGRNDTSWMTYSINGFADLSEPPQGYTYYPLVGGILNGGTNESGNVNYTKNEFSIDNTNSAANGKFGTVKHVTLDKQQGGGLFAADFAFRSDIIHEMTDGVHFDNHLMYQEYDLLSPYLQKYMVSRFGEDIKNYGAYVVMTGGRQCDEFVPGEKYNTDDPQKDFKLPGLEGTFFDKSLVDDVNINPIYSSIIVPSERTICSDYNIYAQQVEKSSIAELYSMSAITKYLYANTDTSYYQNFSEYKDLVETHPAYDSKGTLSDSVQYTDVNLYIAVDDIDSYKARTILTDEQGNAVKDENGDLVYVDVETNGNIYITYNYGDTSKYGFYKSSNSTVQIYQGEKVDITERLENLNHYTDPYPEQWLTCENLDESLAVEEDWGINHSWEDTKVPREEKYWEMAIPFTSNDDTKNVYTKVLGVVTSEDGNHKNIVVVHVVIDYFKPQAELNSVTLTTPKDGTYMSTVDNGLIAEEGQPSKTDKIDGEPVKDVTYYYLSDEGLTGENIQKFDYSSNTTYPQITVYTYNMDSSGYIRYVLTRQDRIPSDGEKYNDLTWNPDGNKDSMLDTVITSHDIVYDEQTQKSTGTATINLGDNIKGMFYGGYYRLDLYYERTKGSKTYKHFASVFIAKQHSPHNTIGTQSLQNVLVKTPSPTLASQNLYDAEHPDEQTGYIAYSRNQYSYSNLWSFYFDRETNDCRANNTNYSQGNGIYYALKGYLPNYPGEDFYLDVDNPIYNSSDDSDKGKNVHLNQNYKSVYAERDDRTGAFYPIMFQGVLDIMAENGDVRHYATEQVQTGVYGENDERTKDNDPNIYIVSATKNGLPITNSTYTGIVDGNTTSDVTFTCNWNSSNVLLYHENNRPVAAVGDAYTGDGFSADKVRIFYTPINSDTSVELTSNQIDEYFSSISCHINGTWTFTLKNIAPVGTYSVMPYMEYHMDLSSNTDKIKIYDNKSGELISVSEDNNLGWKIPYKPFTIENRPNDDSYLTEFNNSNDQYTPFVVENSNVDDSENRDVYIRSASENQEIVYIGYDDVKTGDNRVSKFNIYSYVAKTEQQSVLRIKAPYMATAAKWEGDTSPFELLPYGDWTELTPLSDETSYKEYNISVDYNPLKEDGEYSYEPSVTYYKVTAEDGKTSTIYSVYVVPGVRNKETSLEIAQSDEIPQISGSTEFKKRVSDLFNASDKIYNEILENNGAITATIKELNGSSVDVYQTKIFDGAYNSEGTQPYIYNLKSFAFDISVDLPAGYDYDVLLFSSAMDSCSTLNDSQNGFSGKQLILSSSDRQELHIRIVLKRATSSDIWGVQYIWNLYNANTDEDGNILNNNGGYFYNYVYKRED